MNLNNIDEAKKFKPFLDAINKEQKRIFTEKETNKIYWKNPEDDDFDDVEIELEINLDKYKTDILYIPSRMNSNMNVTLNVKIKTNAQKIILENVYNAKKRKKKEFNGESENFNKGLLCQKLKIEGFTPNSIKEVDAQNLSFDILDLSNNESLSKLKTKNDIDVIEINNTKIKTLNCSSYYIYAQNSELERIENKVNVECTISASNSKLKTINSRTNKELALYELHAENTPLEYMNVRFKDHLKYLNIKNTKLPENIKKELIFSIIEKSNSSFLECDDEYKIIFYEKGNVKYSVCKYDMGFRVLDNSDININDNINNLTKFKESFIKKFEDSKEAEIEYERAVKLYKKTTKNTDLIMNLNQIFLSKEHNDIDKIINKCSKEELNQRNIYGKSAICYVDNWTTYQKLISAGYEITEKDLPYLIKSEVQTIKNIAENLTIKNSITKEKQKNIVENEQKIKHVNKNVL